ncbi:class I adenylate-forming enzyme family protein [Streptomyces sp. NPDC001978]|uniref:class I adenylate-forming enzyme family protein n=1 Tax=Streptomyces sp. NPDC001978 TaxID=3364627 RepID=UPI0036D0B8FB
MYSAQSTWKAIGQRASRSPDDLLIVEADGVSYTYAAALGQISAWRSKIQSLPGPSPVCVAALMPNQAALHLLRLACTNAGRVFIAINPLLRGKPLVDALERSGVTDLIVSEDAEENLSAVRAGLGAGLRVHRLRDGRIDFSGLVDLGIDESAEPESSDVADIMIYTSGTSGPAKPVRLSPAAVSLYGRFLFGDGYDHWATGGGYYSPWHPAHVLGAVALEAAILRNLTLVTRRGWKFEYFWDDVQEHNCKLTMLISVAEKVWASRSAAPAPNCLDMVGISPAVRDYRAFGLAFDIDVLSIYGMTELGTVLTASLPSDNRVTGTPSSCYECRIDPLVTSSPASTGFDEIGELVVRPLGPRSTYAAGPDDQFGGWVDGWFHTGDRFSVRSGEFRFEGRVKDSIRHHGRNISAFDLEFEVRSLPGVKDCVTVGHSVSSCPSDAPDAEQEVRVFVLLADGASWSAADLLEELAKRLPMFMVPRYVDLVSDFPRTLSGKVSRAMLRGIPLGDGTYDRKAGPVEGLRVSRTSVGR